MDSNYSNDVGQRYPTGFESNVNKSIAGDVVLKIPLPQIDTHRKKISEIADCISRLTDLLTEVQP